MDVSSGAPTSFRTEPAFEPDMAMLQDHFPGNPVIPAYYQLARVREEVLRLFDIAPTRLKVKQVKFLHLIRPGEAVSALYERRTADIRVQLVVNGVLMMQGEFSAV